MTVGKKRIIIIVIVLLAVLAAAGILINANIRKEKVSRIEEEILLLPSKSFHADELDGLQEKLEKWSKLPLSDTAMGVLYGRLAYIASQKGDWQSYYTNFGKEQYYLEVSGDYEGEINSLCDILFYTYLSEGRIDKAKETLDRIDAIIAENGLENQQLASMVYRHHSAIAYYENDFDAAAGYAERAGAVLVDLSPNYCDTYIMGADMLEAKALCGKGEYDKASVIVAKHSGSALFNAEFYPSTLNNVCLIPYYQVLAYIDAADGDESGMLDCAREVVSRSIRYDYEQFGLDTLDRLRDFGSFSEKTEKKLSVMKTELDAAAEEHRTEKYSDSCDEIIASGFEQARKEHR